MKSDLAIIGASYLQVPLIKKAQELGYKTHVFAWEANDVGEKIADCFYPISIIEKEKILLKCKEIGIEGICSIGSDLAIITVNYVACQMGLTSNTIDSTLKSTNKHLMRQAFSANNDPSPISIECDEKVDITKLNLKFPIIVKPTDRSGSRGITKLNSNDGLEEAIRLAMDQSFEHKALVEEFAEGTEYSVEFVSWKGKHHYLAITKKFTTGAPHFIETGHMEPVDEIDVLTRNKIIGVVTHALNSLGLEYGASHSEIKIDNNGNIKIIEIGGRMGGDCIGSHLVYYSTGIDYLKAVIDIAVGMPPVLIQQREPIKVKSVFLLKKEDFDELERLQKCGDSIIEVVDFHPEKIGQTTDSSNRCGCYVCKC